MGIAVASVVWMAGEPPKEPVRVAVPDASDAAQFATDEGARIRAQCARVREADRALRDEIAVVLAAAADLTRKQTEP